MNRPEAREEIEEQIAEYEKKLREQLLREDQFAELAARQQEVIDTKRFLPLVAQSTAERAAERAGAA